MAKYLNSLSEPEPMRTLAEVTDSKWRCTSMVVSTVSTFWPTKRPSEPQANAKGRCAKEKKGGASSGLPRKVKSNFNSGVARSRFDF